MKIGKYGPGNTDFSKLRVRHLPIHIFNTTRSTPPGCGASCLSMLTGIKPEITGQGVRGGNYTDSFMLKFLRKHKISAYQVSQANLSNKSVWKYTINDEHVILISMLVKKRESTWMLIYNDAVFHNFESTKMDTYSMFNFPIVSMYILHKQQWK